MNTPSRSLLFPLLSLVLVPGCADDPAHVPHDHSGHNHAAHEEHDHHDHSAHGHEGHDDSGHDEHDHSDHEGHDHGDHNGHNHEDHNLGEEQKHEGHDHHDHEGHHHENHKPSTRESHERHDHHDHEGHDHGDHQGHDTGIVLSAEQLQRFNIRISEATGGPIASDSSFPAEVKFNGDHLVHLVPRVSGVASRVEVQLGDVVAAGQILAVINSRELADAKADFLSSLAEKQLANKRFTREKRLRDKGINSEEDTLTAEETAVRSNIALRNTRQKLLALGQDADSLLALAADPNQVLTQYHLRSPISGTVIHRHLVTGEHVDTENDVFTLVDLSTVWVEASIPVSQIPLIAGKDRLLISDTRRNLSVTGKVTLLTPFVDPERRNATVRVLLDNTSGEWLPGQFVTVQPPDQGKDATVLVPADSILRIDGEEVVFIPGEEGFITAPVTVGRRDATQVEILKGLSPGARYVKEGAFHLKAVMVTQDMDPHAGHGH